MNKTALIAMSGGVDSSVAAYLIKSEGYDCEGVTMRLFHNEENVCNFKTCCSDKDVADARRVAGRLSIPYSVVNYMEDFDEKIIKKFVRTYENGGTPNPCIDCNRYMKFKKLLDAALARGRGYIVTGHYARRLYDEKTGRYILKKGLDTSKDQSYVLYGLTQDELAHTLLPLGGLGKDEVRKIAGEQEFINAGKAESQDICFVPDGDYASFIERYTGRSYAPGDFVDHEGKLLGKHKGLIHYTIGQRKGLGIAAESPYFVTGLDTKNNRVMLSHGEGLFSDTLTASDINLISVPEIKGEIKCAAKVRYRQKEQPCSVIQTGPDSIKVVFDEPLRAITKGQAVVLYDGDTVIGGGTID
ncbi:MAG: tRNA 2-thiouridine(34) synthase MnmA [Lachnospiraceae bacterium]|nr:tRNA 2-thiouridine(34) synthase MnmA [Lachnospiraceae bacterium]